MAPRLLSLLTLIESALMEQGCDGATSRVVNYRRRIARMSYADGRGGVSVQNFALADGQICVRLELHRPGLARAGELVLYPQAKGFDWAEASTQVAQQWLALAPLTDTGADEKQTAAEGVLARVATA